MEQCTQSSERKKMPPWINLSSKAIIKIEGEIKTCHNKQKLKQFISIKPVL
jgi:hypothetical protein